MGEKRAIVRDEGDERGWRWGKRDFYKVSDGTGAMGTSKDGARVSLLPAPCPKDAPPSSIFCLGFKAMGWEVVS